MTAIGAFRPQRKQMGSRDQYADRTTIKRVELATNGPVDTRGRRMHDLRISVTDRCNFRCTYCMPREVYGRDFAFLPREELLTFEEITRLARLFAELGVRKVRLTGGEPLLRRDLPVLVRMVANEEIFTPDTSARRAT